MLAGEEESSMKPCSETPGDRLAELLCAWRRDIRAVPMPVLIDPARAAEVIGNAVWASQVRTSPDDARTPPHDY
jgi:hypothetical protein